MILFFLLPEVLLTTNLHSQILIYLKLLLYVQQLFVVTFRKVSQKHHLDNYMFAGMYELSSPNMESLKIISISFTVTDAENYENAQLATIKFQI